MKRHLKKGPDVSRETDQSVVICRGSKAVVSRGSLIIFPARGLHGQFESILMIGAKAPATLQFSPWTLWLEPKKPRELWLEFGKRPLPQLGTKVT